MRVVRLAAGFLRADVIGPLIAADAACIAFVDFLQHGGVPCVPLGHQPIVDIRLPLFQVGALHRIGNDVEEKRVVENLEVLVIAISEGALFASDSVPEDEPPVFRTVHV